MQNIVVFSMNNCGYCEAAKTLLKSKGLKFIEKNISNNDDEKISLMEKTGHRTMPQIFIDNKFIGGYTELKAHLDKL